MSSEASPRLVLVAPPLDGPATGGTLYNRQLLAALAGRAQRRGLAELDAIGDAQVWVDSLHLSSMPALRARLPPSTRLGLVLHYLPSLLHTPELSRVEQLTAAERDALDTAEHVVTPSAYLAGLVAQLAPGSARSCVEPAVASGAGAALREPSALLVCNVTPNKGVLPLLAALGALACEHDHFTVQIAGELELEPAYAAACRALCEASPWLKQHVRFLGSLAQPQLFEQLARAGVCVSASRMESYGMALAEARAHAVPLLACPGGNVAQHVAADSGGELAPDVRTLAAALVALFRAPAELARRQALARAWAAAHPARSWQAAANDFLAAAAQLARFTGRGAPGAGRPDIPV